MSVLFTYENVFVCVLKEKPAKGRLFHTQKNLAELEECCEHPWRDLFLWAVLQNRQQMANYFWAMVSFLGFSNQFSTGETLIVWNWCLFPVFRVRRSDLQVSPGGMTMSRWIKDRSVAFKSGRKPKELSYLLQNYSTKVKLEQYLQWAQT